MLSGQDQSKSAKGSEVKQRHPGFTVSNGTTVTPGRMVKPQEVIISQAVKQLNKDGYVVFNTREKQDVYVTVQPESAFFDDEEPAMVRMAGGSFVGAKHPSSVEVPIKAEPGPKPVTYAEPADIFSNASRRAEFEEIDFNEIIIKKNETFEEEIVQTPTLFKPTYVEINKPVLEETFVMKAQPAAAVTSTGTSKAEVPKAIFSGFKEVVEYEVEEVPFKRTPVTDVPAGLYVDGHRPIDVAEADAEETDGCSSFEETSMNAEMAVTSDVTQAVCHYLPLPEETEAVPAEFLQVEEETETILEESVQVEEETETILEESVHVEEETETVPAEFAPIPEEGSITVSGVPPTVNIADEVADVMKLTIPELHMSEDLLSELAEDLETAFPEDGLESYDCIFRLVNVPAGGEDAPCTVSCGSEETELVIDIDPSVNLRCL
ncbi:MAG: hypothetical protein LBP82_02705 [Candidatus Methanoplasma sp.]|jgi:hypothetical protein|nr:hypothetical protein [Candidatus Methanoplasma sp.]